MINKVMNFQGQKKLMHQRQGNKDNKSYLSWLFCRASLKPPRYYNHSLVFLEHMHIILCYFRF